jgi:hypothetical protein
VQNGVGIISITDHDQRKAYAKARKASARTGVILLDGVEHTTISRWEESCVGIHLGHVQIFNADPEDTQKLLDTHPWPFPPTLDHMFHWVRWQREQGKKLLVVVPHAKWKGDIYSLSAREIAHYLPDIDAMEGPNMPEPYPTHSKKWINYWEDTMERFAIAEEFGLPLIGGSDAHTKNHMKQLGSVSTILYERPSNSEEVIEMIALGQCQPYLRGRF